MGALRPGYEVTSEITLVRRLGAGGMGTVWLAKHSKLHTEVVVKFLSEQLASDEEACSRFEREVLATLQVRSPHVVQTLDHGITDGGIPYLVMEWLEGHDLGKEMRTRGQLPPDEVMHVIEGLTAALTKAHERGIVHRDIKPANVFLVTGAPRPFVKLVDFGIAKRLEDETMTATNALLGTPAYMSPEQMDGVAQIDPRTDLWALGVLTFHMLTGAPPFRGSHIAHIAHAIMHGERPKLSISRPELPLAIDGWIERALARDPAQRFATARELADTLAMALGDLAFTTSRRVSRALGTGPHMPPPSWGRIPAEPSSIPGANSSVPVPVFTTGSSLSSPDMVGATLGATANTHSPYGRSPRLKWWVMGVAAIGVVLVGISFKIGYGLRPSAGSQPEMWSTPPPPTTAVAPPPATAPATTVAATPAAPAPPPTAPATTTTPTSTTTPAAKPTPAKPPVAGPPHRPPAPPRPTPGPKPKGGEPADDVGF